MNSNRFSLFRILSVSILSSFIVFTSFIGKQSTESGSQRTIVIDAGHGGKDNGSSGKYSSEKQITLQVALKLGKALENKYPSVNVMYTRTSDVFVDLYKRIDKANVAKADMFLSIHCNSMPANSRTRAITDGTESFVSGFGRLKEQDVATRENASILLEKNYKKNYDGYDPNDPESIIIFSLLKNSNRDQSIRLARALQKEYTKVGRFDRGYKEQSLAVLAKAGMPAVLTEIGFISNPRDEEYMNSEYGQNEIVSCQVKAIESFFKLSE